MKPEQGEPGTTDDAAAPRPVFPAARVRWLLAGLLLTAALTGGWLLLARRTPSARREGRPPGASSGPIVRLLWTFEPAERGAVLSTPLVAGNRVWVAVVRGGAFTPRGALYCLDRHTRRVHWRFDGDGSLLPIYSSPCLAGDHLYIGEGMHGNYACNLRCLNTVDGREVFRFAARDHIESSPCVSGGRVFFGAGDDGLYALRATDGALCWHFQEPLHIDTSPAVEEKSQRLYAGSGVSLARRRTEAFCLDTASGKVLWRTPTPLPVWGSPVVDNDRVYFGLGNGRLNVSAVPPERPAGAVLCLDARDGRTRWRRDLDDAVFGRPVAGAGRVYAGSRDGYCYCLERDTGRILWRHNLGSPVATTPALADGKVFVVASGGRVCCLHAGDGSVCWTYEVAAPGTEARLYSSPVVVADADAGYRIYFGAELRNAASSAAVLSCLVAANEGSP